MREKKVKLSIMGACLGLIILAVLLVEFVSFRSSQSKLNSSIPIKSMNFFTIGYHPLEITETRFISSDTYFIVLQNDNDYKVSFTCESTNKRYTIECPFDSIEAGDTLEMNVKLTDSKVNSSHSSAGTQLGIRVTYPYHCKESNLANPCEDPGSTNYVCSDQMIVSEVKNFSSHISSLIDSNPSEVGADGYGEAKFIGNDPNNYVNFNGESWRVLGVVGGRVKLISTVPYGDGYYDGDATGTKKRFAEAKINTDLNTTFYDSIGNKYRDMIDNGSWNVGGYSTWVWQTVSMTVSSESTTKVSAKVGLINASDYVYATGGEDRDSYLASTSIFAVSDRSDYNWLFPYASKGGMWTLNEATQVPDPYVVIVSSNGNIDVASTAETVGIYPVVYLKNSVGYFDSGATDEGYVLGSANNPYNLIADGGSSGPIISYYRDSVYGVFLDGVWLNFAPGTEHPYNFSKFAKKDENTTGGARIFDNATFNIPDDYIINSVIVYDINDGGLNNPLVDYERNEQWGPYDAENDQGVAVFHRKSNFVFVRETEAARCYSEHGKDAKICKPLEKALESDRGKLQFVVNVVKK